MQRFYGLYLTIYLTIYLNKEMKIEYKKKLLSIAPYIPGKPIKQVEKKYGIKNVVKLASNENPFGTSAKALEALKKSLNFYFSSFDRY